MFISGCEPESVPILTWPYFGREVQLSALLTTGNELCNEITHTLSTRLL